MNSARARPDLATPLGVLCACLAVSEEDHDDLREVLAAGRIDWRAVLWLAGEHLVTPSLLGALQRKNLLSVVGEDVQEYLVLIQGLNRERNDTLRSQLMTIVDELNRIDVVPLLIKGAIALLPDQYPGSCDRVLGDLDIVVPAGRLRDVQAVLSALEYSAADDAYRRMTGVDKRRLHHLTAMTHRSLPVCVEVHHRVLHDVRDDAVLVASLERIAWPTSGATRVFIPDAASRIAHSFLHSQVSDRLAIRRIVHLRQLLEFAHLSRSLEGSYSAQQLHQSVRDIRMHRLAEYWSLAERWLGATDPEGLARSPAEGREHWLVSRVMQRPHWRRASDLIFRTSIFPGRIRNQLVRLWEAGS